MVVGAASGATEAESERERAEDSGKCPRCQHLPLSSTKGTLCKNFDPPTCKSLPRSLNGYKEKRQPHWSGINSREMSRSCPPKFRPRYFPSWQTQNQPQPNPTEKMLSEPSALGSHPKTHNPLGYSLLTLFALVNILLVKHLYCVF